MIEGAELIIDMIDEFFFFFFFLVKGNIYINKSYPTPEVRPLQVFLIVLTLQTPTKSELIRHKISTLGGILNTAKVLFIE